MKGCKICGMPHSSAAHQRAIRSVGGYVGGVAGSSSSRRVNASDQTQFDSSGNPTYPQPQSVRNMPAQLAGYDDDYNVRGQVASTENMYWWEKDFTDKFLNKTKTVYVNPRYKEEYDNVGNDPDSAEYVSNYKGPMPIHRMRQLAHLGKGIKEFSSAIGKYFDKDVVLLPHPNAFPKDVDPLNSTIIDVRGYSYEPPVQGLARTAGYVSLFGGDFGRKVKKTGKETYKIVGPQRGVFNMNTNLPPHVYEYYPDQAGTTAMHEFGHVLGMQHPEGYKSGGAQNSIMSYAQTSRDHGVKFQPADINTLKEMYKWYDVKRRAEENKKTRGPKVKKK